MAKKTAPKAATTTGTAKKGQSAVLTVEKVMADFGRAYEAKRILLEREEEDFRFAMGEQWSDEDKATLKTAGFKAYVDNRIQPNLFLLTGLERQNRTDLKAFPEGQEDSLHAEIASALLKDAVKKSGLQFKSSEQFKDGITCGESHLEFYLDYTDDIINGKPCWRKCDGNTVFPDPASREYDFTDARYVFKITTDIAREDLLNLYADNKKAVAALKAAKGGKLDFQALAKAGDSEHTQKRDYDTQGRSGADTALGDDPDGACEPTYDLVERYYKKYVERAFIGDYQTGEIKAAESKERAEAFLAEYRAGIERDQAAFEQALGAGIAQYLAANPGAAGLPAVDLLTAAAQAGMAMPPEPPEQNPDRFIAYTRQVPEIWCFAFVPGIEEPLADERAWSYPKWKGYPFAPYFARFSTAPLEGEDRHLRIQGLVHGVKGAQEILNKSTMLMMRHLNTSTNSGWLTQEGAWVDPKKVEQFGSSPSVNLEYHKTAEKPTRIEPAQLSAGHGILAQNGAQSIKDQLGINADLLATQEGSSQSGRAIALRQRQGLLMVQEPFDNLSRTRKLGGQLLLSQLGEMYDTESAKKVLGEAFLRNNFPVPMLPDPDRPGAMLPIPDKENYGQPMPYDRGLAEIAIAEVLDGDLGAYDVSVGEVVASESLLMAQSAEIKELKEAGVPMPPELMVEYAQIPEAAKTKILSYIEKAQALAAAVPQPQAAPRPRPVPAA